MKKQIFLLILLFSVFSIFSLSNITNFCRIYPTQGADNESLLLWQYAASIGIQQYKDIFYPYGLLNYYKDSNIFFALIYFFLTPALFIGIFLALKQLFQDKVLTTVATVSFLFFIGTITGFETFTRYGPLVVAAIFFSYVFYKRKQGNKKILIISGALTSLLFPLINDFGFYTPVIFIVFAFIETLISTAFNLSITTIKQFLRQTFYFFSGYFLGLLPFFSYLILTHSFSGFLLYLQNLHDIAQFAKTPFFHSIGSIDNIFTIGILISTIFFLSFNFFLGKKTQSFNTYLQIVLTIVLLLLEQKSIIRSIDTQITFIGLLLFFCFFYECILLMQSHKVENSFIAVYFINFLFMIIFLIGLHPVDQQINLLRASKNIFNTFTNKSCIEQNVSYLTSQNKQLLQVKDKVSHIEGFNGKVFTFPGEPIFYILFKQIPPYYPTIYEATPLYAQLQLIHYIETQHINIVIYNSNVKSIHDEVPDAVRGRFLYSYLQTNYSFYDKVGNYLIYKRNSQR